jgi:integrase
MTYWLTDVLPAENKRTGTATNYANVVRLYIDPTIGRIELAALSPADVRRMLSSMSRRGLSPNTQRLARSVLRRALRSAEIDGLVTRNVASLVDGVRVPRPKKGTLEPDEARSLLALAEAQGHGALITVLLGLGLRRGEAVGLRWRDIRLDAPRATLTVAGAIAKAERGALCWEQAKADSERTVHLPRAVADVLRRHRSTQAEERLAYGPGWARDWLFDDMVFTTSVGTPRDPDKTTRLVTALAAEAGLGHWTPHGMRHSAASILIAQGVPLKVVSEMLGHSSIRVTADIYGHLMEPARLDAADAMQAAIFDR